MTDRQPGAPGQYKLILDGVEYTVTLTRDDQPLVEGTPLNKASILPDELAIRLCPAVTDPTPADAYAALLGTTATVVLAAGSWSNDQQRVAVAGVTATNNVFASPDAASYEEYTGNGVRCISQTAGYLVFQCDSTPDVNLNVNVLVRP